MAKNTPAFLNTLLEQIKSKAATHEIVIGAWHLAVKSKDIDAMAAIAAADDLPPAVLAAVMKRNEIPVAVSYLTRPGLDIEERRARIRAEERAGVLAGVLECDSITDDDREVIAVKLVAKPTRALAEATIADHKMPLNAVAVAIVALDSRMNSLTDQQRRDVRHQIKRVAGDADASAIVAKSITSSSLASSLLGHQPDLSDDVFERILTTCIEPDIVRMASGRITPNTVYYVTRELRPIIGEHGTYHTDAVLALLQRQFDDEYVAKIWTDLVGATRAAVVDGSSEYTNKMLLASTSSDEATLTELVAEAANGEKALVEPLVLNPNLNLEHLKALSRITDDRLLMRRLPSVAGDEQQIAYIYTNALSDAIRADQWKSFPDATKGQKMVFDEYVKRWRLGSGSYYSSETREIMNIIESVEDKAALIAELPWTMVEETLHYYGTRDGLWHVVSAIQARHLGDDLKKWETAEALAQGFAGTVEELFFSAATL